ncbi:MAG: cytoplasmic protein [Mycobacteriaceae bacterium]|nr:cytoplasmic protein [Mycobacteriaceae bacterium]
MNDPIVTDPDLYRVLWENERVRVLEYRDTPGEATHLHSHPDSVMITLSAFRRVIAAAGREVSVDLEAGQVRWLDAQHHRGRNVGSTPTHSLFIELKEPRPGAGHTDAALGPSTA